MTVKKVGNLTWKIDEELKAKVAEALKTFEWPVLDCCNDDGFGEFSLEDLAIRNTAIVRMILAGKIHREIAEIFSVTPNRISQVWRQIVSSIDHPRATQGLLLRSDRGEYDRIMALHRGGKNFAEIARFLGRSRKHVFCIRRKYQSA